MRFSDMLISLASGSELCLTFPFTFSIGSPSRLCSSGWTIGLPGARNHWVTGWYTTLHLDRQFRIQECIFLCGIFNNTAQKSLATNIHFLNVCRISKWMFVASKMNVCAGVAYFGSECLCSVCLCCEKGMFVVWLWCNRIHEDNRLHRLINAAHTLQVCRWTMNKSSCAPTLK